MNLGIPSVGNPATLPKITVNISVVSSGWITTHAGPRIVCL